MNALKAWLGGLIAALSTLTAGTVGETFTLRDVLLSLLSGLVAWNAIYFVTNKPS